MSSLREQFNAEAHAVPALGDIDAALAQVAKERRRLRRVASGRRRSRRLCSSGGL